MKCEWQYNLGSRHIWHWHGNEPSGVHHDRHISEMPYFPLVAKMSFTFWTNSKLKLKLKMYLLNLFYIYHILYIYKVLKNLNILGKEGYAWRNVTLKCSIQSILFTKYLYNDVQKHNKYSCILIIPLTKTCISFRLNKYNVEIKISKVRRANCIIGGAQSQTDRL